MNNSFSESYKAAGVDVTAGYKSVELMKKHVARTKLTVLFQASAVSADFLPLISKIWKSLCLSAVLTV
jgi:phosphoribosylaminoimidazole (AIR) synthetase